MPHMRKKQDILKDLRKLQSKNWHRMTLADRNREAALYTEFGGISLSETRPATAAERKRLNGILKPTYLPPDRRKRAKALREAKRLSIVVESRLVSRLDAFAKANKMSRSEIIARSLETMLARA